MLMTACGPKRMLAWSEAHASLTPLGRLDVDALQQQPDLHRDRQRRARARRFRSVLAEPRELDGHIQQSVRHRVGAAGGHPVRVRDVEGLPRVGSSVGDVSIARL